MSSILSDSSFGTNNLEAKTAEAEKQDAIGFDDFNEIGTQMRDFIVKDIPKNAAKAFTVAKNAITPGFFTRFQQRKIHIQHVGETEKALEDLKESADETRIKELAYKRQQRDQDRIIRELLNAKKHLRDEVNVIKADAQNAMVEKQFKEYHVRRDLQLAELNATIAKEKEDKRVALEKETVARRVHNIKYYGEQAVLMSAEAAARSEGTARERRHQESLDRTFDEFQDRQFDRTKMQVDGVPAGDDRVRMPGGTELGLFGGTRGGLRGPQSDLTEEMFLEDVDQHDVHLFDAHASGVEYENAYIAVLDSQARLAQEQSLYAAIQTEGRRLKQSVEQMKDMRDLLERDQVQITQEQLVLEREQLGPPRRMAMLQEIPAIDLWKNRAAALTKRQSELQYSIDKAESMKVAVDAQVLTVAQSVASLQEACRKGKASAEDVNGDLGMLPMVVGRGLAHVPGLTAQTANPREMFSAITHQSRLVDIRDQSVAAARLHKDRTALDQDIWLERLKEKGKNADMESVVSRLVEISDRLQRSGVDTMRLNIIDSLKGFLKSGLTLNVVRRKLVGMLPWFKHHDPTLSHCVHRYVTTNAMGGLSFEVEEKVSADFLNSAEPFANGVTLGEGRTGYCCGVIELPKNTLWSVLITVSKQYVTAAAVAAVDGDGEGGKVLPAQERFVDPTDFLTVRMGPTMNSMGVVGTFLNTVNPLTGTVLYDVRYVFRGSSFAFRFDFSSSSLSPCDHLAVCPGIYEEYEMKPLEAVSDPKIKGRQRVLSSYVKMLRINEATGTLRETKLLEELIAIEGNPAAKIWDSAIVSQTLQRYSREYFLRILRAEILLQQEVGTAALMQHRAEARASKGLMANADVVKEALLEASMKRYTAKKRGVQRRALDAGRDMVGKRIVLWDAESHRWRNITIMDCRVKWVENGLVALVTHVIQEYDDGLEPLGDSMEVNLTSFKYFESPVQVVDPLSVARWREKKRWDDAILAIEDQCVADVKRHQIVCVRARKKEERKLRRAKRNATNLFENNIDAQAQAIVEKPAAQRALRVLLEKVHLDIRKGIVPVDELATSAEKKVIAAEEARRRFVLNYVTDQRSALTAQLTNREEEAKARIDAAQEEFDQQRNIIVRAANVEKEAIKKLIRAQLAKRRKLLMQKVKFDPAVFKTVVPQATHCEHLKTKAWGSNYGKGVRCVKCGKELEELYKEESQLLGYGSGCDPALYSAVLRHRQNEQSFRFKNSAELGLVERERRRLEKERREMDEGEVYFYDLQDLKAIYEFDHRHARSIKAHGIFRQGLQWTETELETFEEAKRIREMARLEAEGLPESLIDQYDALAFIQEPPPTFRAADERRRAQYNELLFAIGRLHNFSRRIHAYKLVRFELLSEREMFALVLEALHKDSYVFEAQLTDLERDLDKTQKLMSTFRNMQLLWQQANYIQGQARRDKAKAEMARCGVWEAVAECQDRTSMIKDETRSLLRVKLLMDAKLDNQVKAAQFRRHHLEICRAKFEESEKYLTSLRYCSPGSLVYTRYGQCYVCYYRQSDDMLMVTLPFGRPPAKAYIHYTEVIHMERSKQRAEMLLMGLEDAATGRFVALERVQLKKERYAMQREEEGLRQYHEFCDLGANEVSTLHAAISHSVEESFGISETAMYRHLQSQNMRRQLAKMVENRRARRKDYIGPPSGRPNAMGFAERQRLKGSLLREMKQKFILDAANRAERLTETSLLETRSAWAQNYAFEQLIDSVIMAMIGDVAEEAHSEGRVAKGFAERKSGIMFPQPTWMQYGTYNSLATIWRARKDELRFRIEVNQGECAKTLSADPQVKKEEVQLDPAEVERLREARRLRRAEKERQAALCREMAAEEIASRNFYRWELLENLRERRRMKEEDRAAMQMRKDEEKARVEVEAAYSAIKARPGQSMAQAVAEAAAKKDLSYENRRQQLKELTLERRRREEDQALMALEDALGDMLREVDRLERQKKAYEAEFGPDDEEEDDDESGSEESGSDEEVVVEEVVNADGTVSKKVSSKHELGPDGKSKKTKKKRKKKSGKAKEKKLPDWLVLPRGYNDWDQAKQHKYVERMTRVHVRTKQIDKNVEREYKRLARMEAKSTKAWESRFRVVEQGQLQSELVMMEADEDVKDAEARLIDVRENMMRILIHCRDKGEEELKLRSELKRLQEVARRRDRELEEATAWLDLCVRRAKNRDKLKRRVSSDCKWVDTDTINGFHQRFATELLREKLYFTYFRQIVSSIVNRAEIIATERNLMDLQERLSQNKDRLVDRTSSMKGLLVDIRREERMRMRRSFLNEKFFASSRRKVLLERFGSWVRYYMWNRGHKEAFQLKYEVIRRQLDIDRQFREQLGNGAKSGGPELAAPAIQTIMQKHRERPMQCKSCFKCYLEAQNTSISCQFHPKQFILECPRTCPNPGLTDLCVAHRKRRWTCCDAVRQDATGCSRRYHTPPDSDPVYDRIMEKINERDRDMLLELDSQWDEAQAQDWVGRANNAKRGQVFDIEDSLAKARATADRFKDLKFV